MAENRGDTLVILIPIYNDWASVEALLYQLDTVLDADRVRTEVLLVDDGSTLSVPPRFIEKGLRVIRNVNVLQLKRNLGHQRAIATGLVFVYENISGSMVLIMDGDGEDGPEDVSVLLERFYKEGENRIIFAERTKRTEGFMFKLFYHLYKTLHMALTGVPIPRRKRISGQSQMGFISLVIHGLSAISVYGQIVGVRLLIAASVFIAVVAGLLISTVLIRLMTNLAIPGWATFTIGLLLVMVLQTVAISFLLVFMILYSRSSSTIIPIRDCGLFIGTVKRVFANDAV